MSQTFIMFDPLQCKTLSGAIKFAKLFFPVITHARIDYRRNPDGSKSYWLGVEIEGNAPIPWAVPVAEVNKNSDGFWYVRDFVPEHATAPRLDEILDGIFCEGPDDGSRRTDAFALDPTMDGLLEYGMTDHARRLFDVDLHDDDGFEYEG